MKINEIARHNTVHVFKLKEKDIFSPFTAEYEMLSKSVIDINNPDIQTKLEALKAEHETYLKTIRQKELDELEEKQLSPARQLLITEEKTLRSLWFEMETVRGLYLQSKRELENSNDALLYEKQLKHMLASTKSLLLDLEKTMQAKYTPANVWGQFEKLHSRNDQKGFTVMVGGMALALLLAGAFFWQYHHYLQQPRIHSLAGLEQQTGKRASFHLNENLLDSITDENAKYFEYIKQKASFFHRIDRHCGVILVNTLDPKATSFWCKLIASTGVRVCWLAQREIEDFLLKEYTLHQTMHQGLSAHLQKKINLPSAVYATNFQNLFVSPMDAKSRLPKTPDFSALKTSIDEKFDYLIVNSHPHQIKKHYQYFAEQVEYQINCVFEDTTLVAELFLDAEKKHPNTQILNAFFSGRSG